MTHAEKSVLLLHGWPGTSDDYHLVRNLLHADIKVIAPDLAGFGEAFDGDLPIELATADAHANTLNRADLCKTTEITHNCGI